MSSLYGGQSSDCKHLWGKVMVNRFCTHFQHSLIDQKALEPSNLSLEGSLVLPSPISPGEGPMAPTGLRHRGPWHDHSHVRSTHSLRTSQAPYSEAVSF